MGTTDNAAGGPHIMNASTAGGARQVILPSSCTGVGGRRGSSACAPTITNARVRVTPSSTPVSAAPADPRPSAQRPRITSLEDALPDSELAAHIERVIEAVRAVVDLLPADPERHDV